MSQPVVSSGSIPARQPNPYSALIAVGGAAVLYTAFKKKTILPLAAVPLAFMWAFARGMSGNPSGESNTMIYAAAGFVLWPWIRGGKGGKS